MSGSRLTRESRSVQRSSGSRELGKRSRGLVATAVPLTSIALVLTSVLSGCVSSPTSAGSGVVAPSTSVGSAPTSESSGRPASSPTPTDGCGPPILYEPWSADTPLRATLGGNRLRIPVDLGSRANAAGESILDDEGHPVAYAVAPDDLWPDVADRFCLHPDYINALNQVRRNGVFTLYVGDTLNLSPYTVTSVGSENGDVFDNPAPDPLPTQRQL